MVSSIIYCIKLEISQRIPFFKLQLLAWEERIHTVSIHQTICNITPSTQWASHSTEEVVITTARYSNQCRVCLPQWKGTSSHLWRGGVLANLSHPLSSFLPHPTTSRLKRDHQRTHSLTQRCSIYEQTSSLHRKSSRLPINHLPTTPS